MSGEFEFDKEINDRLDKAMSAAALYRRAAEIVEEAIPYDIGQNTEMTSHARTLAMVKVWEILSPPAEPKTMYYCEDCRKKKGPPRVMCGDCGTEFPLQVARPMTLIPHSQTITELSPEESQEIRDHIARLTGEGNNEPTGES